MNKSHSGFLAFFLLEKHIGSIIKIVSDLFWVFGNPEVVNPSCPKEV